MSYIVTHTVIIRDKRHREQMIKIISDLLDKWHLELMEQKAEHADHVGEYAEEAITFDNIGIIDNCLSHKLDGSRGSVYILSGTFSGTFLDANRRFVKAISEACHADVYYLVVDHEVNRMYFYEYEWKEDLRVSEPAEKRYLNDTMLDYRNIE